MTYGYAYTSGGYLFHKWRSGAASTLALSLFFTSATVNSSGGVTDVDGTGNALTYTGASHKRQWNADGVLEYAPHNIMARSQQISLWTVANATGTDNTVVAPDGTTTGGTLLSTSNGGYALLNAVGAGAAITSATCRVMTRVKANSVSWFYLSWRDKDNATHSCYFNISGVATGTTSGTVTNAAVTDLGDGWVLCQFDAPTGTGGTNPFILMRPASADNTTSTNTDSVYVWGMQLTTVPAPTTYVATTTAIVYGPRVGTRNRKPVTNLLSYPEQMNVSPWLNLSSSLSSGQADPFGGTNANKIVEASDIAAQHLFTYLNGIPFVSGKTYTFSAYFKAGERTWVRLNFSSGQFTSGVASFNLSTGEIGTIANLAGQGIAPVEGATGWYRCWITATATSSGQTTDLNIHLGEADNDITYNGDGSSGLYIFGAQLNEGGIEDYIGATNLLTDDKAFGSWALSNASVASDSTVAPDGTTTADTLGDNSATGTGAVYAQKTVSVTSGDTYKFSVFLKQKQLSWAAVQISGFDTSAITYIDLANGALGATDQLTNSILTYFGNGWYRYSGEFSSTTDLSGLVRVFVADANNDVTIDLDGTSDIYIWGAQLTKGSTLYPYVGMPQTGFTKQGYLAEAAATNLVTDSEDFSAAAWTINNTDSLTVTANSIAAPDGTTTMDLIDITDTTNETKLISDSITISSATDYAISCFAKANEHRYVGINLYISSENFATVVYDLLTGTVAATDVGTTSGTVTASGVIPVGNGVYRIWAALRVTGTAATIGLAAYNSASPTFDASGLEAFAGTAGNGFYAWGMQVEVGTYPSSYIRTSGGTATRAADALSTTDVTWHDAAAGTFVASHVSTISSTLGRIFELSGGGDATRLCDHYWSSSSSLAAFGAAATSGLAQQTAVQGILNKTAAAYAENDMNLALNGAATIAQDTTFTPLATATNFYIGLRSSGLGQINGHIKSLEYYSERKSDADLATLSTITDDGTTWRDDLA